MSKELVTLVAAAIAAAVSLISLAVSVRSDSGSAMKAAHREVLRPYLEILASNIHEVMAASDILHKRFVEGQETEAWLEASKEAADRLKVVRPKVRYPLYGIDESLRSLTRIPDQVATYKNLENTNYDAFIRSANKLSTYMDEVIRLSYSNGRPPSWYQRIRMKRKQQNLEYLWNSRFDKLPPRNS